MALIFDNVNNQIVDDHGNVIAPLDLNLVVRNIGGAPSLQEGLFSGMPSAGTAGRLYISTDTDQLLRDNGTSWDVIGAAGAGSVTSVGLTAPPQFAVSGSPITTFGNLNLAWNTQSANKIFAGPSTGTDALPTFRNLTVADLPAFTVPFANITSTPTTLGGYGITNAYSRVEIDAMTFNWSRITGTPTTLAGYGITDAKNGTVTSVQASGGITGLSFTGGPIVDSGTLTLGGTLAIANGGTGATTANGALNALLPIQTGSSGYVLTTDGANTTWAASTGGSGSGGPAAVRLATTGALPTYTASGAGVGKTLTGTAVTALTIDGVTPAVNDRVLVKDETSTASTNNGVYVVTQQGTGASGTKEVWTITIPSGATGASLNGKDFWFSSPTVDYYMWLYVGTGSAPVGDPAPAGRTNVLGAGNATGFTSANTAAQCAANIAFCFNNNSSGLFTATSSGNVVTVTAAATGPAKNPPQNDSRTSYNPSFTYVVTSPGAASHPYILTRASDFITPKSGALVPVVLGGSNADTIWMLTTDGTIVLDTTQLTFTRANQTSGSYVNTFNTRSGAVTLTSGDVTTALTYTPYNATNPSGYITSAGTATNVSGIVAIANGGTGLSGAGSANRLLGVTNAGGALEYKTIAGGTGLSVTHTANNIALANTGVTSIVAGTGVTISGATGAVTINSTGGSVTSVQASGGTTGLSFSGGPITGSGTLTLAGTLAIANGGTGATTASAALTALLPTQSGRSGFVLGTDGTSATWKAPTPTVGYKPVRLATTSNLAWTFSTFTDTLTAPASGLISIDGLPLYSTDRILVKDQTLANQNGVYTVSTLGGPAPSSGYLSINHFDGIGGSGVVGGGQYINLYTSTTTYYIWFTVDGTGLNPSPSATMIGSGACALLSSDTDVQMATKIASFINTNGSANWTATLVDNRINLVTVANAAVTNVVTNGTVSAWASGYGTYSVGTASTATTVLTRDSQYTGIEGTLISVSEGTANADTVWIESADTGSTLPDVSWWRYAKVSGSAGGTGTVTSVQASGGTTGLSFSGGPVTTSGTLTLAGTLNVANGGTGASTLTGYVKGSGTSAMTASATIPTSDLTGTIDGGAY